MFFRDILGFFGGRVGICLAPRCCHSKTKSGLQSGVSCFVSLAADHGRQDLFPAEMPGIALLRFTRLQQVCAAYASLHILRCSSAANVLASDSCKFLLSLLLVIFSWIIIFN